MFVYEENDSLNSDKIILDAPTMRHCKAHKRITINLGHYLKICLLFV